MSAMIRRPSRTCAAVSCIVRIGTELVPRTRSSHHIAAGTVANFGFKSGTGIIDFPVSFSIPKFAQNSRQMLANFGIGTLEGGSADVGRRWSACGVGDRKSVV
jgi:hypothetical protein